MSKSGKNYSKGGGEWGNNIFIISNMIYYSLWITKIELLIDTEKNDIVLIT